MQSINRRRFIGTTAGVAAGLAGVNGVSVNGAPDDQSAATGVAATEQLITTPPPPMVTLGKTDIQLSRVGQGTGVRGSNRQSNQTRLGFEKLIALFRHAYDRGIRFFDLADLYGTHIYFREALRSIPREEVAIMTKLWWRFDGPDNSSNAPERAQMARTALQRFRHELGTDMIDIVLLHCLQKESWDQDLKPYMEVLDEAKAKGQVRAVGVSCHNLGALQTAATSPWVDVILARINPKQVKMDGTVEEVTAVLRQARQQGKGVIGMKIYGEGKLVNERDDCIKFAQELGLLDAMTIGLEAPEQIDDLLRLIHKYPATANIV
jgi:aryl-alcohol dehydrogenase-like predicted oxidoreductase